MENIGKYREIWDKDTKQLKKPDTFCLLQTRKLQIIELNAYVYFNNNTLEHIFEKKCFYQIQNMTSQRQKYRLSLFCLKSVQVH